VAAAAMPDSQVLKRSVDVIGLYVLIAIALLFQIPAALLAGSLVPDR